MSDHIGPIALESNGGRALFGKGVEDGSYSETMSATIDNEVKKIITEQLHVAEETVKKHKVVLDIVAKRLIEVETIEREEYEKIIVAHGIPLKQKKDIEHQAG
jgi:cell division protease FtsH